MERDRALWMREINDKEKGMGGLLQMSLVSLI